MKHSGTSASAWNEQVQAQIAGQLYPPKLVSKQQAAYASQGLPQPEPDRLRQNKTGLNKTEAAFLDKLRADYPGQQILPQGVTLLLANGLRYTPDFFVPHAFSAGDGVNCAPMAWEVKGPHAWEDSIVKLKVAARVHPWVRFFLATKRKAKAGGGWQIQEILP